MSTFEEINAEERSRSFLQAETDLARLETELAGYQVDLDVFNGLVDDITAAKDATALQTAVDALKAHSGVAGVINKLQSPVDTVTSSINSTKDIMRNLKDQAIADPLVTEIEENQFKDKVAEL